MTDADRILDLIQMLRMEPGDAAKYYELGIRLGRARKFSCGRERDTFRAMCRRFCCAEWALRKAWTLAPQDARPPWALDAVLFRPPKNTPLPQPQEVLRSSDENRRIRFLHDLGMRGGRPYENVLLSLLGNSDVTLRRGAVLGLGEIGDPALVPRLLVMLEHDAYEVQEAAATALGLIGDQRAVEPLIARCVAADEVIPPAEQDESTREFRNGVDDFFDNVELSHVRAAAAWALGMLGDIRAVEALAEPLPEHDADFRAEAVRALSKFGRTDLISEMRKFAEDGDASVRAAAVESLAAFPGEMEAVEILSKLADSDRDAEVRFTAAVVLGRESEPPEESDGRPSSSRFKTVSDAAGEMDFAPPPDMPEPPLPE